MSKPLWVLDTNVVLDLFHFDDAAARPLRQAFDAGTLQCAASPATLAEWRRVLGYPEFGLDAAAQAALYIRYAGRVQTCSGAAARLPRCSDPDDQKFLELAAASGAQALVSKDRALLSLRRRCAPWCQVLTPAEAARVFNLPSAAGT